MELTVIKNRLGDLVDFDKSKIKNAILKAYDACLEKDLSDVDNIVEKTINHFKNHNSEDILTIEQIQDAVENSLMEAGKFKIAKAYIVYRRERAKEREKQKDKLEKKLAQHSLKVVKSDGTKETFDISKVKKTYKRVVNGLEKTCKFEEIEKVLKNYIVDGIKTSDITKMLVKASIDLISIENSDWQFIASRFMTIDLYKEASKNRNIIIDDIYTGKTYKDLFDEYIKLGHYYKDYYKYYSKEDIKKAGEYIKKDRDFTYNYTTIFMFKKRYLLNPNKIIKELPQEMYMSAALFLAIPEKEENRLEIAKKIYDACSLQKISLPTPTLLNSRTNFHQLSSCFKLNVDDDLRSIYHNVENMAQISKYGGGIGVYLGNIRAKGGSIRGIKGASGGVNPWIKVINDTAIAVNQLGARMGSISVTLDIWHRDIYDFLDLQTETGDIRRKAYDVFPAISVPDIFMKRVQENASFTLFDPKEVTDKTGKKMQDFYGEEFEKFYIELEKRDDLEMKETINAKELFKKFLKTVVETGMPYTFFRDTVNKANPNKHAGMVYSTQLCVEICQNTSVSKFIEEEIEDGKIVIKYEPGDTVVCNLASINVAKVNTDKEIQKIIPIAMKILDNVIDLNFYPIKEAELTAKKYRSVGLGFLGLAEHLAVSHLNYDSEEARNYTDKLFEKYAYATLKASNELAKERGVYPVYEGSDWSKGILLGKDAKWYKENSSISDDWINLIEDIKKYGVRFAYHLAPAPNTSTALVVGTTASVLPIYKKYFVETNKFASTVNVAPNLTPDNFWYYKEYVNLNMKDVIDMMSVIYKWIDQSLSFEWIINPEKVSPAELYSYYIWTWESQIKTIYYVRSMSLEVKECVSCSG
ncbi:MAG: ribonucleoside-diphosphate reductase subunit alpha [Candidatus Gracilibacteria bacterium]|nr:ribonucleoside-diphosphate reductase subunit alpha [Candidatus Gracilibacteria bacterium]